MAQKKQSVQAVVINKINIQIFHLKLIGNSPLIVNKWAEKAKMEIREKHEKKAKKARAVRDPEQEFNDAMYRLPKGDHAFPACAFKASAKNACRQVEGLAMTQVKGSFFVCGDLIKLYCSEPVMREDMVRTPPGTGGANLRYRPMYETWGVELEIKYNADFLSAEQIINLFNIAGFCSGVGEWRPSSPCKDGSFGMFRVVTDKEWEKFNASIIK